MTTALDHSHYLDSDINIFTVAGEADNSNTELAFAKIYDKIRPLNGKKVLLDLRPLTYCNSMFLGHIAALHVDLANKWGNLALVVNEKILDPFTITGLDRLATITLDFDIAIKKLKKSIVLPRI